MLQARSCSVDATHRIAGALEPLLCSGDVLILSGDLGAGKTAFVQGLAVAMNIADRVTSPTFVLIRTYEGRLRLHHLDAYRLENGGHAIDLDLPHLLSDNSVVAIEWGELLLPELPPDYLQIRITFNHAEPPLETRIFEFYPVGPSWSARITALAAALQLRPEVA